MNKSEILKSLTRLDQLYLSSKSSLESKLYSKLAISEVSGFIEESFDQILLDFCLKSRKRIKPESIKQLKESIKKIHSFRYQEHLKPIQYMLLGIYGVDELEKNIGLANVDILKTELDNLATSRNSISHTYISGSSAPIDSPSITISIFKKIYPILKSIEKELRQKRK